MRLERQSLSSAQAGRCVPVYPRGWRGSNIGYKQNDWYNIRRPFTQIPINDRFITYGGNNNEWNKTRRNLLCWTIANSWQRTRRQSPLFLFYKMIKEINTAAPLSQRQLQALWIKHDFFIPSALKMICVGSRQCCLNISEHKTMKQIDHAIAVSFGLEHTEGLNKW